MSRKVDSLKTRKRRERRERRAGKVCQSVSVPVCASESCVDRKRAGPRKGARSQDRPDGFGAETAAVGVGAGARVCRSAPRRVTPREWYCYYSYERRRHPSSPDGVLWDSVLAHAGRLAQEYICAGWIKAEDHRLSFLASAAGQKRIRAENYGDLKDHLGSADADADVGRVIFPATSRGSPRKLKRFYEDHGGCPSLRPAGAVRHDDGVGDSS